MIVRMSTKEISDSLYAGDVPLFEAEPFNNQTSNTTNLPSALATHPSEPTTTPSSFRRDSIDRDDKENQQASNESKGKKRKASHELVPPKDRSLSNSQAPVATPQNIIKDAGPRATIDDGPPPLLSDHLSTEDLQDDKLASSNKLSVKDLYTSVRHNSEGRMSDLVHLYGTPIHGNRVGSYTQTPDENERRGSWSDGDETMFSFRAGNTDPLLLDESPTIRFGDGSAEAPVLTYEWNQGAPIMVFEPKCPYVNDSDIELEPLPKPTTSEALLDGNSLVNECNDACDGQTEPFPQLSAIGDFPGRNNEPANDGAPPSPAHAAKDGTPSRSIQIQEPRTRRPRAVSDFSRLACPYSESSLKLNRMLQKHSIYVDRKQKNQTERGSGGFIKVCKRCGRKIVSLFECSGLFCCSLGKICCCGRRTGG